jgi:ureidoglycolate hydrolase
MTKKLAVQELTREGFAGCGDVVEVPADHREGSWEGLPFPIKLDAEAGFMPNSGEIQILAVTVADRPLEIAVLERHTSTPEMVIPLGAPIWLPAAPPSEGTEGPDLDQVGVFEIKPHQAVVLRPGAYHFAPFVAIPGSTASLLAVYSRGTLSDDTEMIDLDEAIEVSR